jgi:hypothetical protein
MADKWYTVSSGNWSVAANWNGGTLPVDGDDVFADSRTITIDQHINLPNARLFTTARSGGTAGGGFLLSGAWNVTCLSITPGTSTLLTINNSYTGTITCPIINSSTTSTAYGISVTAGAAHAASIIGNFYAGNAAGRHALITSSTAGGTITLNGTAYSTTAALANCISHTASGGLTIQGVLNLVQSSGGGVALLSGSNACTYNLTGTISCGGSGAMINVGAGQTLTYDCTSFAWNNVLNGAIVVFASSSAQPVIITMPSVTMHNNATGPTLATAVISGTDVQYTGDVVAGICPIFSTSASGAKLEHFGKITSNIVAGARLSAGSGSQLIIDKVIAAANGNFIAFESGFGIRVKDSTIFYLTNADGERKAASINGGTLNLPIAANVRSGVTFNNGTQTGTMLDHVARFNSVDTSIENARLTAEVAASSAQS